MQLIKMFFGTTSIWPSIFTIFAVNAFILYAFHIEKKLAKVLNFWTFVIRWTAIVDDVQQ